MPMVINSRCEPHHYEPTCCDKLKLAAAYAGLVVLLAWTGIAIWWRERRGT